MKQLQFAWFNREERRGGWREERRVERGQGGVCRHQTTCPALIVYLIVGRESNLSDSLVKSPGLFKSSMCHLGSVLQISLVQEI